MAGARSDPQAGKIRVQQRQAVVAVEGRNNRVVRRVTAQRVVANHGLLVDLGFGGIRWQVPAAAVVKTRAVFGPHWAIVSGLDIANGCVYQVARGDGHGVVGGQLRAALGEAIGHVLAVVGGHVGAERVVLFTRVANGFRVNQQPGFSRGGFEVELAKVLTGVATDVEHVAIGKSPH